MPPASAPDPSRGPTVPPATNPRQEGPQEVSRRLDGLRGWLDELDRKIGRRSVVFLVLMALAIGAAGAAIYLSLSRASDADRIDALETRIENLEAAASGVAATDPTDTGTEETVPPTDEAPVVPETTGPQSGDLGGGTAPDAGIGEDGASGGASP